jgi:L-Ala-D/L-Glu epimerase
MSAPTIAHLNATLFRLPMRGVLQWGQHSTLAEARHVLVEVTLSDGSRGCAEAPPRPTIYGETAATIPAVITSELAPRLLGLPAWDEHSIDPFTAAPVQAIQARLHQLKNNHTAKGAVDMALHAAIAQHRSLTLAEHLGARQSRLRVSFILGMGDADSVLQEAIEVVRQGVRVLKVKVGRTWETDLRTIATLQAALGPTVDLYADANECMNVEEAPRILAALAEHGLLYCEEPLPVELILPRAELRAQNLLPLIADDSTFTVRDLQRELSFNTFDILNIKTARTGFTESAAMLQMARNAAKGIMIGSQASTGLGTLQAAHFAALPGIDHPSELSFFLKLEEDLLTGPIPLHDGYLHLADLEQLEVDPDRLRAAALPVI